MALNKSIVEIGENNTKYHRIKNLSINLNSNEIVVEIESYTSKEHRDKAKTQIEIKERLTKLVDQYESAIKIGNHELEIALLNKLDSLRDTRLNELNKDYSVGISFIELDSLPKEFTLAAFYNKLIENPKFKGAKEI